MVAFVESLSVGMNTLTKSAELIGEAIDEEPTKFELWLSKKMGKSVEKIIMGLAAVLAVFLAVGLFSCCPSLSAALSSGAATPRP